MTLLGGKKGNTQRKQTKHNTSLPKSCNASASEQSVSGVSLPELGPVLRRVSWNPVRTHLQMTCFLWKVMSCFVLLSLLFFFFNAFTQGLREGFSFVRTAKPLCLELE